MAFGISGCPHPRHKPMRVTYQRFASKPDTRALLQGSYWSFISKPGISGSPLNLISQLTYSQHFRRSCQEFCFRSHVRGSLERAVGALARQRTCRLLWLRRPALSTLPECLHHGPSSSGLGPSAMLISRIMYLRRDLLTCNVVPSL